MSKKTLVIAVCAGLFLGLGARSIHAASMPQSLDPTAMTTDQFNSLFTPNSSFPVMSSAFQFAGAPSPGTISSQVFTGTGAAAGLNAYVYQVAVNSGSVDSVGDPAHVDSFSFHFNDTPVGTDLTNSGHVSYSYLINGPVGSLGTPVAAPGDPIAVPQSLSWQADPTSGILRARYVDPVSGTPALNPGATTEEIVVLSAQPPVQTFVNLQSADPQSGTPVVYGPQTGTIAPIPVPEPVSLLAWAGLAGLAFRHRLRKARAKIA